MDQQQSLQEIEAANGVVGSVCSLHTFGTHYSHTHVACQDHIHVVGTVTNRKRPGLGNEPSDQLHDGCLLIGATAATHDRLCRLSDGYEVGACSFVVQRFIQTVLINH
jgi:hypothetical protein